MTVREQVPLADLTTFRIGGPAAALAQCDTIDDLTAAVRIAADRRLSLYPIGEGSNVLAADTPIEKMLIQITDATCIFEPMESRMRVTVGAGMHWDELVSQCVQRGLWGIENLAGIPGTVGAAPVQNIGAYGVELADVLESVDVFDMRTGEVLTIPASACRFAYRDSRFKHEPDLLITRVSLLLSPAAEPRVAYPDLRALADAGRLLATPVQIAEAVREIRSGKFPDLATFGTAGSFFKNPVITDAHYARLLEAHADMPGFSVAGGVKVPLAWILDKVLGLRGFSMGPVHLFERQPLVVLTEAGARAAEVDALAATIIEKVFDATRIAIEREVRSLA